MKDLKQALAESKGMTEQAQLGQQDAQKSADKAQELEKEVDSLRKTVKDRQKELDSVKVFLHQIVLCLRCGRCQSTAMHWFVHAEAVS